jgi:16S rRNA (guanine966-N2)-methyltransferase
MKSGVRITGGTLRGRIIPVPRSGVRPTQERVREALFSILGPAIHGSSVLDLFAGSGALGLEAFSRGADSVCWVEQDARTYVLLKESVATLCGPTGACRCLKLDVFAFLRHKGATYDFILADPPYVRHDTPFDTVRFLDRAKACLASAGCLVFEQRSSQQAVPHPDWTIIKDKVYGETRLVFYRLAASGTAASSAPS